jgi:hypothetical protein
MRPAPLVGIILIVVGIIALAYQGITYTTHKKVLDLGPLQATETQHHTIPLPPVLGAIALIGGVVVLVAGSKSAA